MQAIVVFFFFPFVLCQVGMFKIHPEIPESMSAEAKSFILRCFEPDPDKRAFAHELLVDEFLKVSSKKRKSPSKLSGKEFLSHKCYCSLKQVFRPLRWRWKISIPGERSIVIFCSSCRKTVTAEFC